ncbi:MAG: SDR family oxidoreductase, partial [Opitutales bacterium]|nr:SDR family oxidoreductase [Opitutales bacterium]
SSIDGPRTVHIGNSNYAASKGALSSFMKGTALELAPQKIRANAILPGMTETPLIHSSSITEEQLNADRSNYPLQRYGKPEEIAYAAVYLLSDAAAWTTGTELVIDGGFTLR